MFDTKFAIVLRDDLAVWQKLNVAAFLAGGTVAATPGMIGEPTATAPAILITPCRSSRSSFARAKSSAPSVSFDVNSLLVQSAGTR